LQYGWGALLPTPVNLNINVALTLTFTLVYFLFAGVWSFAILGPYLFLLTKSNTAVGSAEGLQGAAEALAAIPAGFFADKLSREKVLSFSATVGFLATLISSIALLVPSSQNSKFFQVCFALVLWGIQKGLWSPALEALFADSLPSGNRSELLTLKYSVMIAGTSLGPLFNIVFFGSTEDVWSVGQLTIVFVLGVLGTGLAGIFLLSVKDSLALGAESDALTEALILDPDSPGVGSEIPLRTFDPSGSYIYALSPKLLSPTNRDSLMYKILHPPISWIPGLLAISDVLYGIASGMTVKFFPLFFKNESHLPPTAVNFVFVLSPLFIVLFSAIATSVSKKTGRVQTVLIAEGSGIFLLFLMAALRPYWSNATLIIVLYVIRTGLMNCGAPLQKSILMDFVDKSSRARWNSLDNISSFGWSGSAVVGGILIDRFDYGATFIITAFIQLVAWSLLIPLVSVVPRENPGHSTYLAVAESDVNEETPGLLGAV